jgi:hypothetical protein
MVEGSDSTRAESTFKVTKVAPLEWTPGVTTGLPFGEIDMVKEFSGDITGRSETRFIGGISPDNSTGGYVALESFDGEIKGLAGTCAIVHMQTITNGQITLMKLAIVTGSGTGDLAGISGDGEIMVDADGTHRLNLNYVISGPDEG